MADQDPAQPTERFLRKVVDFMSERKRPKSVHVPGHAYPGVLAFQLAQDVQTPATAATLVVELNNSGAATTVEKNVYDVTGIFQDGVSGNNGIAMWSYGKEHWQIVQLNCT